MRSMYIHSNHLPNPSERNKWSYFEGSFVIFPFAILQRWLASYDKAMPLMTRWLLQQRTALPLSGGQVCRPQLIYNLQLCIHIQYSTAQKPLLLIYSGHSVWTLYCIYTIYKYIFIYYIQGCLEKRKNTCYNINKKYI